MEQLSNIAVRRPPSPSFVIHTSPGSPRALFKRVSTHKRSEISHFLPPSQPAYAGKNKQLQLYNPQCRTSATPVAPLSYLPLQTPTRLNSRFNTGHHNPSLVIRHHIQAPHPRDAKFYRLCRALMLSTTLRETGFSCYFGTSQSSTLSQQEHSRSCTAPIRSNTNTADSSTITSYSNTNTSDSNTNTSSCTHEGHQSRRWYVPS